MANLSLNKTEIKNILTIRYNPLEKKIISGLKWRDLRTQINNSSYIKTQKLLESILMELIPPNSHSISVALSGGIDSSITLALIRKIFPDIKITAICGVFKDAFDESINAKLNAENFSADFKIVNMESVFTNMPKLISITKKPKWNTYNHLISKEAKKHSNILITGDGADEIFGGYTFRYSKFLTLLQPKDNWKIKTINYLECHNRDWVPDQECMFGSSINFSWNKIYIYFRSFFSNPLSPLQQVFLADFNGKLLHDFIPTIKSISTYYNLKIISPFLHERTIKFGMRLPNYQKYDHKKNRGKIILRKIAKRMKVNHLEEKKGFSPSFFYDWKEHGKNICESYILKNDSTIYQKKLINKNWVLRAFEKVENDSDIRYLNRLLSILALEIWFRIFITKEITGSKKLI